MAIILPEIHQTIPQKPGDMLRALVYRPIVISPNLPIRNVRYPKSPVPPPINDSDPEQCEEAERCLAPMKSFHDLSVLRKETDKKRRLAKRQSVKNQETYPPVIAITPNFDTKTEQDTEPIDSIWRPKIKKIDSFLKSPKSKNGILPNIFEHNPGTYDHKISPQNSRIGITLRVHRICGSDPFHDFCKKVSEEKRIIFRDHDLSDFRIIFPYLYKYNEISDMDLTDIVEILNICKEIPTNHICVICNFIYAFVLSDEIFSTWEIDEKYRSIVRTLGVKLMNITRFDDTLKEKKRFQYNAIYVTSKQIILQRSRFGPVLARKNGGNRKQDFP